MRRIAAGAFLAGLVVAATAYASSHERTARALESDPLYVHPREGGRLAVPERGRVRLAIAASALGRVKVAVVPGSVAGDPSSYKVDQARAAIAAGRRHLAAARARLG